jgi:hypothetical protein
MEDSYCPSRDILSSDSARGLNCPRENKEPQLICGGSLRIAVNHYSGYLVWNGSENKEEK